MQGLVRGVVAIWFAASFAACGAMTDPPLVDGAYSDHGELADLEDAPAPAGKGDAIAPVFDPNYVVSDAFYLDSDGMSADEIQAFLEDTPYGTRSWLAGEYVDGKRVADVIAETSVRHNIHPMMILSRFQVEGSNISKSRHPGARAANRALGCGCFDGQACYSAYSGLAKQIDCAADTMERRFQGSVDGTWEWRRGRTKSSLDGIRITPSNHATAALYAYTPWVLRGRGGNWLVWNILKKFLAHVPEAAATHPTAPGGASGPLWVGSPCVTDNDCGFVSGENFGFCYDFVDRTTGTTKGFCSLVCDGFCPDKDGAPTTFCIEADVGGVGVCAQKAEAENNFCANVDGTIAAETARFVDQSGAPTGTAQACVPNVE